jgi:uncharacterized protein (DUF2062 family)
MARLPKQGEIKKSRFYRIFGATLLAPYLWSFREEPIARGVALGTFVAFTPTIGVQMALTCVFSLFFPGNLPIALAICWVTNPATAAPIYYAEYLVGEWLLGLVGYVPTAPMEKGMTLSSVWDVGGALWFGSIIVSLTLAVAGYYGVHGMMALERRVRFEKLLHLRRRRNRNGKGKN